MAGPTAIGSPALRTCRGVAADWPAAGSKIHHAAGVWPAVARDETVVDAVTDGQRLVLTAKGHPLGEARVVIELTVRVPAPESR